jgi:hypothetical protein
VEELPREQEKGGGTPPPWRHFIRFFFEKSLNIRYLAVCSK